MKGLLSLCFLWCMNGYFAAKVMMLPMFGPSHYLVLAKLGEELYKRGHQVTIFIDDHARYASEANKFVKVFKIKDSDELDRHHKSLNTGFGIFTFFALFQLQKNYCDDFLSDEKVLNELKTTQILVGDSFYMCSALVAAKFDIQHVTIAQSALATPTLVFYGISGNPSYIPQMKTTASSDMGLIDRIKNLGNYLLTTFVFVPICAHGFFGKVKTKHNIKPEESIWKTLQKVDLVLLEKDLVLDHAMPLPPYVKEVGSFMPGPAKPLPPEWEEFMSSSGDDGVILVTFGSMVDTLDNRIVETMNEAFSKLPQKVIWRLNTEKFEGKIASNIKTVRWLPQNDILGHPNTKLFITHAGASGLAEAVYHGVPLICSPIFGDQPYNAQTVEYIGLGEILNVETTTVDQLVEMVNKVLTEKRYKEKAIHLSNVVKMRPRNPVQEAAELIEYAHAVGNLAHLKPKGLELPFYQLYMLDVLLVLSVVFVSVLFVVVGMVKRLIDFCCGVPKKTKIF